MDTVVAFIGMTCLVLIGIACILGLGIVIAYEIRAINRLRRPEPVESIYGQPAPYWPASPLYPSRIVPPR
jgi:hypothetical protein